MRTTIWTPTLAWLAAVSGALLLAIAAPSETSLMGRLPSPPVPRADAQRGGPPAGLPAERTLALVGFSRDHRAEIHSWIDGLRLDRETQIAWVKMPVLKDPGSEDARQEALRKFLASRTGGLPTDRMLPVFADRDQFIRAAGLSGTDHASVLVLDRNGQVLARAEGGFDQNRAQALRETLLAQRD
jgi:hypothetical protein